MVRFDMKLFGGIILGVIIAVALFFAIVGIAAAVNHIPFNEQIVQWFGTTTTTPDIVEGVEDAVEQIAENTTN